MSPSPRLDTTTLAALAALLLSLALPPTTGAQSSAARGTLFIVGGGPQPPSLVREFVQLAGGSRARIVIFAKASADGLAGGEEKAGDFRQLGAEALNVWVTREQASTDSVARLLDGATGVQLHVLPDGARFDPATGVATLH